MPLWTLARGLLGPWLVYGLVAALVVGVLGFTYHAGYSRSDAAWSAKYERREAEIAEQFRAEQSRIAQVNALAKAVEAARLSQMAARAAELEQRIKEMSDEADADPDRDRVCLSDGSRLRIDSVR